MLRIVGLGAIVVTVSVVLLNASSDVNDDGCVDLQDYSILQEDFTGPCEWQHTPQPAYLVMALPENQSSTITNPRAPQGETFYLTVVRSDTVSPNHYISIFTPPEWNVADYDAYIVRGDVRDLTIDPPLPFSSTLRVHLTDGFVDYDPNVIFIGYYAAPTPVEHLEPVAE